MVTWQQDPVTFIWRQFHKKYPSHQYVKVAWKYLYKISIKPRDKWVNICVISTWRNDMKYTYILRILHKSSAQNELTRMFDTRSGSVNHWPYHKLQNWQLSVQALTKMSFLLNRHHNQVVHTFDHNRLMNLILILDVAWGNACCNLAHNMYTISSNWRKHFLIWVHLWLTWEW